MAWDSYYGEYDDGDVYDGDNVGQVVTCWSCEAKVDLDLHEVPEDEDAECPICEDSLFAPVVFYEPNEDFCADC